MKTTMKLFKKNESVTFKVNIADIKIKGKDLTNITLPEAQKIAKRIGGVSLGKKEEIKDFIVNRFKSIQSNGIHEMIGNSVISKPKKKETINQPAYKDSYKDRIINLNCKKHVKIYKMSLLGLPNDEIAKELGTNNGHVWNVLNNYKTKAGYVDKANKIKI